MISPHSWLSTISLRQLKTHLLFANTLVQFFPARTPSTMAEIAGTALAAVSVGDPLIKAIRGLRRVYRATKNAPDSLIELEHTGNTIHIYLAQLDDDVKRNPSKCTSVFSQWLEDEKKVLTHSVTEIKDFTCKVQNGLQKSTILGGVAYAMEVSEIWKIQNRLASHISILEGMRRICENESIESRVAALELSESKKLRARTISSLEACSESWCNVSSSMDETCSVDNESSYQEVLMKSKSYTRAAMRQLMSPNNIAAEPLVLDTTLTEGEVTLTSWEDVNHVLAETSDDSIKADPQSLQPLYSHERSSIYQSTLQLTTSSTHSSSSQRQDSSAYSGWSTQDTAASISTPMTTQSDESFNGFGFKAQRHRNKLSVKVEVEGFGSRLVELDELGGENLYDQVICVISTLRENILQSINKSQLKPSLRPKEQGIITYQTSEESEAGLTLLFNKGFLAGAVEALNDGVYTRLTVFATFVLSELDEEQDQILHKLKMDSNRKTQWDPAQFPSIDTVLKLANQPQRDAYSMNGHTSSILKWAYDSSAEFTVYRKPIFHLVPGGPEWAQKQTIAEGGSSIVYRVKLFKSHESQSRGSEVYALKEFKQGHERTFRREVEAYTQLASRDHPHIMALLMAYELGGRFHLLFPWANGSLANFFQHRNPDPDPETTSWVGLQCAGLADALQRIHTTSSNVPSNARTAQPEANYGRHGDLKPENILWFEDSSTSLGTLKIADFGLSRLRSSTTRETNSSSDKRFVGTLAYSAPDHIVSSKYDIWSLGCIYLDFVCWLLGGQESVKEFHHARCIGGDGRGYLTNKDGSVRLHPSLSDPRSRARSITHKRRLEKKNPPSAESNWQQYFLDVYCHVIQRCLDLDLTRRPSAREVARHLRAAVSQMQQTNPLSINPVIGFDKRLDAQGVSSKSLPENNALTTRSPTQATSNWAQTRAANLQGRDMISIVGKPGTGLSTARSLTDELWEMLTTQSTIRVRDHGGDGLTKPILGHNMGNFFFPDHNLLRMRGVTDRDEVAKLTMVVVTDAARSPNNSLQELAPFLIEKGASVEPKDTFCRLPLSWAAHDGHHGIAKLHMGGKSSLLQFSLDHLTPHSYNFSSISHAFLLLSTSTSWFYIRLHRARRFPSITFVFPGQPLKLVELTFSPNTPSLYSLQSHQKTIKSDRKETIRGSHRRAANPDRGKTPSADEDAAINALATQATRAPSRDLTPRRPNIFHINGNHNRAVHPLTEQAIATLNHDFAHGQFNGCVDEWIHSQTQTLAMLPNHRIGTGNELSWSIVSSSTLKSSPISPLPVEDLIIGCGSQYVDTLCEDTGDCLSL
ncbi:hypothetical protein GGR55DRAFT_656953 [Xylaria sp. FL0064]|nr:hypothetical protein GGR55DRAFT_656953 [Xylaria sp. FL0064]